MVGVIDNLERAGLVKRRQNTADRRFYDLLLTPAGAAMATAAPATVERVEALVFAPLSAEQRRQFHDLLSQLLTSPG